MSRVLFVGSVLLVGCSAGTASKVDGSRDVTMADVPLGDDGAVGGQGGVSGTGGKPGLGGSGAGGSGAGGWIQGGSGGSGSGGAMVDGGTRDGGAAGNTAGGGGNGGGGAPVDAALGGGPGSGGGLIGSGGSGGVAGTGGGPAKDGPSLPIDGPVDPVMPVCGLGKGTLGGSATEASSMQRWKVTGKDCKQYVVQNNNFGNPTGSIQTVTCEGSSFEVVSSTAAATNGPASFPSIYIGGYGDIANGTFVTDSNLPKRVSTIQQVMTQVAWSGGAAEGDFNVTYDVWFAKKSPAPGSYNDAISGSLMVWLKKPASRQPAGKVIRQAVVAGRNWDVWVGPHGDTGTGTDEADRPIVSYVVRDAALASLSFDLRDFIVDAIANGSADQASGGTSQGFSSAWYLTDVTAGFQIWTGADVAGLKCTSFACEVR